MKTDWTPSIIVLVHLVGSLLGYQQHSLCDNVQTVNDPSDDCSHPETCQSMNSGNPQVSYQDGNCTLSYGPYGDPMSGEVFNYSSNFFKNGNITQLEAQAFVGIHSVGIQFRGKDAPVYGGARPNSRQRIVQLAETERVCALDLSTGKIRLSSTTPMVQAVGRFTMFTTQGHKFGPIGLWPDPYVCVRPGNGSYLAYISGTIGQVMHSIMVHFIAPDGYPAWSSWTSCDCATLTRTRIRPCTDASCQNVCPPGNQNQTEDCTPEPEECPAVPILNITVCEGNSTEISCSSNQTLHIVRALFGYITDHGCQNRVSQTNCSSSTSTETVIKWCERKSNCNLLSKSAEFGGNPCQGTVKYLEVQYQCLYADN